MKNTNSRTCIMKIASGPMAGQELMINVDKNHIVIGKDINYKTDIAENGFTTYYIPSEETDCEFSIISEEDNIAEKIAIKIHNKNKDTVFSIILQELLLVDIFPVVIKLLDTPWELADSKNSAPKILKNEKIKKKKTHPIIKTSFIILSIFIVFFSFMVTFPNDNNHTQSKKITEIENILKGTQFPIIVSEEIQGKNLILVRTQRDLDWSMQRLVNTNYGERFIIKKINQFEEELEGKLIELIPNILKIDLSNPCQPVIKKLSIDSEVKSNDAIDNLFSSYFSCYKKIEIHQINSDELLKKSELGLTESDVKWHKIVKDKKIIYVIKDSLNDKQTISLINFTNSFYKEWGGEYIQFSISLENNVLIGKSFITNASGYVLLGNNHWLFNSTTF